jgi:hypothetical protein
MQHASKENPLLEQLKERDRSGDPRMNTHRILLRVFYIQGLGLWARHIRCWATVNMATNPMVGVCALLGDYAALGGSSIPTFRDIPSALSATDKKSKKNPMVPQKKLPDLLNNNQLLKHSPHWSYDYK